MKVFIYTDMDSDWCPKNQWTGFRKFSKFELTDTPESAEIIWILVYCLPLEQFVQNGWFNLFRHSKPRKKSLRGKLIITTFGTHLYRPKRNLYLPMIRQVDRISDVIHFFCERNILANLDYFSSPLLHLPYWIDLDQFYPMPSKRRLELRQSLNIPLDKTVIGSFQRDTEADLVSPKLEKGPDIFCDILESLDKRRYFVLLSGPRRNYVESRLRKAGIAFLSLGHIAHSQMCELYNSIDYYLVTSRAEGGPQAILEAMATKTPIYSTSVGVSDILNPSVVFEQATELVDALAQPYPDVVDAHYATIQQLSARKIVPLYEKSFHEIFEAFRKDNKSFCHSIPHLNWHNVGRGTWLRSRND